MDKKMKWFRIIIRHILPILLIGITTSSHCQNYQHNIIPEPVSFESGKGFFTIDPSTQIIVSPSSVELSGLSDFLKERIRVIIYQEQQKGNLSLQKANTITLKISESKETGIEGYKLIVSKTNITISANTGKGIFYGLQTLFQLLPAEIEDRDPSMGFKKWKVPVCKITDYPRFAYRGMHLDVGRHLFPVEFIKKYIDLMSMYKMNNFHWHLTDDQGWRLEIKKYPLLTEIGSIRTSTPIGKSSKSDNKAYGGFYTQEEAREIVEYAASRYVNIIPEIEMPGHSMGALAAYPQFSCTGGPFNVYERWSISEDIFCAGKEDVFTFLEDVLTEVMSIFPSTLIHIGGDEAPKTRWESCNDCQQRIKSEGLKDAFDLQSYFIQRIEKFLNRHGRRIIGWDEILEGGLAPDATVMSWRGTNGGIEAAKMRHTVIMTPGTPCYFDHYQGNPIGEPLAIGGYNSLKNVYLFEPVPVDLSAEEGSYILGAQGNVWTEYIQSADHVEYMAYPRAIALAEVNWSSKEYRCWNDFIQRLNKHLPRLENRKVNFSKSAYNVSIKTVLDSLSQELMVSLDSDIPDCKILYSIDNEEKNIKKLKYKGPFKIERTSTVNSELKIDESKKGNLTSRTIYLNDATGKIPFIKTGYSDNYAAFGPFTLTDGCRAHPLALRTDWLGFQGNDADMIIDLGKEIVIRNINIGFLYNPSNWIFLPEGVEIYLSDDGIIYHPAEGMHPELLTIREPAVIDYSHVQINTSARYIRIVAKNKGICPQGHPGEGQKAWVFMDEVMVNYTND